MNDVLLFQHVYPLRYSAIATHLAREFTGNLGNNCKESVLVNVHVRTSLIDIKTYCEEQQR